MWWKIILGVMGFAVVGFIGLVIKMAVTDAKEEISDIERASNNIYGHDENEGIGK